MENCGKHRPSIMCWMQLPSGKIQAKSEMLDKHELAISKDGVTL